MKTLAKLVMGLAVLAVCLPADGEILIYSKIMTSFEAEGQPIPDDGTDWAVDDARRTGYLILDVEYVDGQIVAVHNAVQIEYWREAWERYYRQIDHEFGVERFQVDGVVYWILEELSEEEGGLRFVILKGKARNANIGLGWAVQREVPYVLDGALLHRVSLDGYVYKRACSVSLRISLWWTRLANHPIIGDGSFEFAEQDIVKAWLERLRYREVENGNGNGD